MQPLADTMISYRNLNSSEQMLRTIELINATLRNRRRMEWRQHLPGQSLIESPLLVRIKVVSKSVYKAIKESEIN